MHIEPRALVARIHRLRNRTEDQTQRKMLLALVSAVESLDFYSRKTNYGSSSNRMHGTGIRMGSPSSAEMDGGRKAANGLMEIHRTVAELERNLKKKDSDQDDG